MKLYVEQRRGPAVEATHPIAAVMCDASGRVLDRLGPPTVSLWRSAAKPFQLEANLRLLDRGLVDSLDDADLAIGAASHSGQPMHTDRVRHLLRRFDREATHLYCGTHWPAHLESGRQLCRQGQEAGPLHNNCSGKHAFMALAAQVLEADPDYRSPDHPLQRTIRALIDERTGGGVLNIAIDDCGLPTFALPLEGMARAWAQLAEATRDSHKALGRIGIAMYRRPELVSGDDRLDRALIEHAAQPIVAKVGAAGLSCVAVPAEGVGIAIKVLSGDDNARAPAVTKVLNHWFPGLVAEQASDHWRHIKNCVGLPVGERVAILSHED